MARLDADDMIDIVRDNLGGETSETLSDTRILRFINQAYVEVASKYRHPQLLTSTTVTTTSGTATYELSASDVAHIEKIIDDTNNIPLYPISFEQYHEYVSGDASNITGTSVYWAMHGVGSNSRYQIAMYPTPDGTNTIYVYYYKKPAELVTSPTATSPVIPEAWDDVIIHKATSRGWRMLGDMDTAYKWVLSTREIEDAAKMSTYQASKYPISLGSMMGASLK